MKKNIKQLNKSGILGVLYCKKKMIKYYKKYNWTSVKKNQIIFSQIRKKNLFPMITMKNITNSKKIKVEINLK